MDNNYLISVLNKHDHVADLRECVEAAYKECEESISNGEEFLHKCGFLMKKDIEQQISQRKNELPELYTIKTYLADKTMDNIDLSLIADSVDMQSNWMVKRLFELINHIKNGTLVDAYIVCDKHSTGWSNKDYNVLYYAWADSNNIVHEKLYCTNVEIIETNDPEKESFDIRVNTLGDLKVYICKLYEQKKMIEFKK